MLSADTLPLAQLTGFLEQHRDGAYAVLFLGAFFETLIPFSLAVLGEVFFLAGALLAGLGTLELWGVMAALYVGGILGDNASYWIGRRYGARLFERLSAWPVVGRRFDRESYRKGTDFFRRRGAMAVLAARLSGPLSWVMPAMAGIFHLNYGTFLRFNTLGVILGISQFILLGYFFGSHLTAVLNWLDRFGPMVFVACLGLALLGWFSLSVWRASRLSR